ncbi:MAG: tRNA (N6-threonylcarbamoyladenosine(37)-N6)-methyltransferase TrmO [Methanosarcinales archaeon]|nr:tRNA (N6-threonylcarbamoyladenosine(37)-N6)-methyltransferase TrmO [Methanosarcinales archaeon]
MTGDDAEGREGDGGPPRDGAALAVGAVPFNMMSTPALTVDAIILHQQKIVLIKRKNPPFKDHYALPGGFVDVEETVEDAARREAKEETGLDIDIIRLVGIYSDPARDPRRHTVSACYLAEGSGTLQAGSDATCAELFDQNLLPELAFDHGRMIADAFGKFVVKSIGIVRSPAKEPARRWDNVVSEIVLDKEYTEGLDGLDEFSHAVIVFFLHRAGRKVVMKARPRGRADMPLTGIFALRTPRRPNPIGITTVEIIRRAENRLAVRGLDAIDGTPVLDVKPYIPRWGAGDHQEDGRGVPGARVPEWVERLAQG